MKHTCRFIKPVIVIGGIMLLISILEIVLRLAFGFCDAPLVMESKRYEYVFTPNQDRYRFGKHIQYNKYSQRSENPDSTKIIALGLGDSVLNGGVLTNNEDLATSLSSTENVQVLNISAGSWGPDNCAAYLVEKGTFNAKIILLVVSSHDAYDNMTFEPIVDYHKSYRSHQYFSDIWELLDRYIIPRYFSKFNHKIDPDQKVLQGADIEKDGKMFNPGFDNLKRIADENGIGMYIYLHPDYKELIHGAFNKQGLEIIEWAKANGIDLSTGFEYGETTNDFRDGIHLNEKGQIKLSHWMNDVIKHNVNIQ